MQSYNVRAFCIIYSNRMILSFTKPGLISNSSLLLHPPNHKWRFPYMIQRKIHSSNLRHQEDSKHKPKLIPSDETEFSSSCRDENHRVWSVYEPVAGKVVTTRGAGYTRSSEEDSSSGDETPATLASFDSLVGGFSPEKSVNRPGNVQDQSEIEDGTNNHWLNYNARGIRYNRNSGEESSSRDESPDFTPALSQQKDVEKQSVSGDRASKHRSYNHSSEEKSAPKRSASLFENRNGETNRVSFTSSSSGRGTKKKGKSTVHWVCSDCGESFSQWWGTCRSCKVGTLVQFSESESSKDKSRGFEVTESAIRSWLSHKTGDLRPQRLTDVRQGLSQSQWRIPLSGLFGSEVARVLGGGLIPGSLVLFGGDPGVGKSTLVLQIAADLAEGGGIGRPGCVVYVSGEESVEQIGSRADRMLIGTEELFLYSGTDVEDILEKILPLKPRALIVDSIQTVYLQGVTGNAGSVSQVLFEMHTPPYLAFQPDKGVSKTGWPTLKDSASEGKTIENISYLEVKDCTSAFLRFAKRTDIPVLLIGHVTKTGDIAGPRVLEHIVDVVLYMEGEKHSSHRLLRSVKNRYGSTDELGVFEMTQSGLQAVSNPSEIFLSEQHLDSEVLAGLAVAVVIDGSRIFLMEVQALCLSSSSATRHVNGLQPSRVDMIIAVLMKQAGLKLQDNAIFLNVVSGVRLTETAGDLAIAMAVCSSFLECPIPNSVAFIGEIGLGGELRVVPRMEKRINAVAKLGYKKCIVPKSTEKLLAALGLEGIIIQGCSNLKDVINTVFQPACLATIQQET